MRPVASAEYRRVQALPRRQKRDLPADQLQEALAKPSCNIRLKEIQVQMIVEAYENRGLIAAVGVGHGKTLPSILIPTVIPCSRPLLLVPAKLRDQTRTIIRDMRQYFRIHPDLQVLSYSAISTQPGILEQIQPDILLADECHALKDPKSGRTKRVLRYLDAHQDTIFCGFSGTIISKSLFDFAHLVAAALKMSAPLPIMSYNDLVAWDRALQGETGLGVLKKMPFLPRLIETPGIVATSSTSCEASIIITLMRTDHDARIKKALANLENLWILPDGRELCSILEYTAALGQLYCGFYYRWTRRPPENWMQRRRAYMGWMRNTLRCNRRGYDTPGQIYDACERMEYTCPEYAQWIEIKSTYTPQTEAIWVSDAHVQKCRALAVEQSAIVWTQYRAFGQKIDLPYYASDAVYSHPGGTPVCLSIKACGEGKNLQKWSKNVVAFPPTNGVIWEQMIGRTHRLGQVADTIEFTTFGDIDRAIGDARQIEEEYVGLRQKLLMARVIRSAL
jgi:hypothetical protein